MDGIRKIIHVDMDAFYASVEQRDDPSLRGKPVVVGGNPDSRGVVSTCSYEARKFGIRSAMSCARAYRLCPHAVFVRPRFEAYREASQQIRAVFLDYTDLVEPLSLDEAYLDVTRNKKGMRSATLIARDIKKRIRSSTRLTASAGVSFNKFLAKTASDLQKPDGLTVILPEEADAFIDTLPIGKFFGVGRATEEKMKRFGIHTGADLKRYDREQLIAMFGKAGGYYHDIAHGNDARQVIPSRPRRSYGKERTLGQDITDPDEIMDLLRRLADQVGSGLAKNGLAGKTVTLKLKYHDFRQVTRSITLEEPVGDVDRLMAVVPDLLVKTDAGKTAVRLAGITVSGFGEETEEEEPPGRQLELNLVWTERI